MFKRIIALALALVLAASLAPSVQAFGRVPVAPVSVDQCCQTLREEALDPNYHRPDFDGKLIGITPQRVADTFAYLDAHYVEAHPEQALDFYTVVVILGIPPISKLLWVFLSTRVRSSEANLCDFAIVTILVDYHTYDLIVAIGIEWDVCLVGIH